MKTIVAPAVSTAATTSGSRTEPPGWMIAVDPGLDRELRAVGEREEGVGGHDRRPSGQTRAFSIASRTESTRLICPAPMPTVARSRESTIALERTCLHTFQANSSSPHSRLGRVALGDDLHLAAVLEVEVAILDEHAADDLAEVGLDHVGDAALAVVEDAHVRLGRQDLERVVVVPAREQDLDELLDQRLGERPVDAAGSGR